MISHYHKTIFVHIPKCGGQSIEHVFLEELGLSWKNRAPLLLRKKTEGEKAPKRLAHLTLQGYLDNCYISREMYDSYFKFSVVRNPYSRVISLYNYLGFSEKMCLNSFVSDILPMNCNIKSSFYWFFMPQANFIIDSDNRVGVDALLKLEAIDLEWSTVVNATNVTTRRIPMHNVTVNKVLPELSKSSISIINDIYSRDFDILDYDMH